MEVIEKLPLTLKERLGMEELVRTPASWEEFYELVMDCEYKVEYYQNEILSMGFASDTHELIVANIIRLLGNAYLKTEHRVYGSSRLVYVADCQASFNPDVLVVGGQPEFYTYQKLQATTNPYLIVEVQSKSTQDYDLLEKLPCYKKMGSLKYVLFVSQSRPWASLYERIENSKQWLNTDFEDFAQEISIGDIKILLADIYEKSILQGK